MKRESALNSHLSATTGNASRRATTRIRNFWSFVGISAVLMLTMGAGDTTAARYNNLGHRMICTCDSEPATGMGQRGCKQVLLECTHVDCYVSDHMRGELRAALQKGGSDDMILHSFALEYGSTVLEQSTTAANKLIWMVAFAVLTSIAIALVRKRRSRPAMVATPLAELQGIDVDALRHRVRRETEKDDW